MQYQFPGKPGVGLRSPSHEITTTVREDGLTVPLTRNGFLDRDFVLELDQAAIPAHTLIARDGDGFVAVATAILGLDTAEQGPLALKVLLDCSGSMGGDSIAAAKRALLAVLARLTPNDRISLTRFGVDRTLPHPLVFARLCSTVRTVAGIIRPRIRPLTRLNDPLWPKPKSP